MNFIKAPKRPEKGFKKVGKAEAELHEMAARYWHSRPYGVRSVSGSRHDKL